MRRLTGLLVLVILLMTGTSVLSQSADDALVRFVHAIPGASAVDIYVDGQLTATNLDFGDATNYIIAPASQQLITVTPAGVTTPLWEQNYSPAAGKAFTLVASSFADPITFTPFEDLLDPLPLGKARFTTIHAIADADAIDVLLDDGRPMILAQTYDQPYGTLDVPTFPYNLVVAPAGGTVDDALITLESTPMNTGTSYMLLIYGTPANPQASVLAAPTLPNSANDGFVRLVHAVPSAPAVDVLGTGSAGGDPVLLATLTEPDGGANATNYIAFPADDYSLELRVSGTTETLLTADTSIATGDYITAVALGSPDDIAVNILADSVDTITADEARLRVINAGDDALSASLANGTIVANNLGPGNVSDTSSSAPESMSLIVSSASAGMSTLPEQDFYGGVFYDILSVGSSLLVSEAALTQTIGSAPGAGMASLATAMEPTVLPPTAAPVVAAVEPTAIPEAPVVAAQPTAAPIIVTADDSPTGRVFNLNVDANLHLRQYPDSNALSLGTVPFGTILTVNGREGALEEIFISATQVPPDYEFIDPVSLLTDEDEDLAPDETWLNVTYATPDGGSIEAWVRADFVDVREPDGESLPLRDLETVAGNRPGEAVNTDVTPPPIPEDVVSVTVINLDPDANLNVRRTPDTLGEVLLQLPLGSVAEFLGLSEAGDWILLRHTGSDGTITTGWSSSQFLNYSFNGNQVDLDELTERGLLTEADVTVRGDQTIGASPVIAPTVDPTIDAVVAEVALDPGANLNLRRDPDVNGEVLAQVPSGTQLIVTERTADAGWLNVTFEGINGWVAAQTDTAVFVILSFNGNPFDIEDVPVSSAG